MNDAARNLYEGKADRYRALFENGLAAETQRIGWMQISDIKLALGGNLQIAAVKGEERFVADTEFHDEVEVFIQERGIPLNYFLSLRLNWRM